MRNWWKEGVAYQAYVRSFQDSNNDGIGDIQGLISRLDYLKDLGIDILYLNPINASPNDDNGYDISDYYDIMEEFGTLEDVKQLVNELHDRDMKFVMDIVVNHTSDEHKWFEEAKKSVDNPYHGYFIWADPVEGNPPNQWGSFFGGSAWEYVESVDKYYLHLFSKKQPDLNWENESLRQDIYDMIRFWADLGVDGFRLDAINHLGKDLSFPEGKIEDGQVYSNFLPYVQNLPVNHDYLKEMRKEVFDGTDIVLIGETGGISAHNAHLYTGDDVHELHMTFHFDMHSIGRGPKPWISKTIDVNEDYKDKMQAWQIRPDEEGWCPVFYSNHDTTRTVSRMGDDGVYHYESATMLAGFQLTHKGTPFIYYGDEIGMTNAWDFALKDYRDVAVFNQHKDFVQSGLVSEEDYLLGLHLTSRDNSRTPMQWDDSDFAGFSSVEPWIDVNGNKSNINVEKESKKDQSILRFYQQLIALRHQHLAFVYGSFKQVDNGHESVYAYERSLDGETFLVIGNYSNKEIELPVEVKGEVVLSNEADVNQTMKAYGFRIYKY